MHRAPRARGPARGAVGERDVRTESRPSPNHWGRTSLVPRTWARQPCSRHRIAEHSPSCRGLNPSAFASTFDCILAKACWHHARKIEVLADAPSPAGLGAEPLRGLNPRVSCATCGAASAMSALDAQADESPASVAGSGAWPAHGLGVTGQTLKHPRSNGMTRPVRVDPDRWAPEGIAGWAGPLVGVHASGLAPRRLSGPRSWDSTARRSVGSDRRHGASGTRMTGDPCS